MYSDFDTSDLFTQVKNLLDLSTDVLAHFADDGPTAGADMVVQALRDQADDVLKLLAATPDNARLPGYTPTPRTILGKEHYTAPDTIPTGWLEQ